MLGDPRVTGIDERLTDSLAQRTGWNRGVVDVQLRPASRLAVVLQRMAVVEPGRVSLSLTEGVIAGLNRMVAGLLGPEPVAWVVEEIVADGFAQFASRHTQVRAEVVFRGTVTVDLFPASVQGVLRARGTREVDLTDLRVPLGAWLRTDPWRLWAAAKLVLDIPAFVFDSFWSQVVRNRPEFTGLLGSRLGLNVYGYGSVAQFERAGRLADAATDFVAGILPARAVVKAQADFASAFRRVVVTDAEDAVRAVGWAHRLPDRSPGPRAFVARVFADRERPGLDVVVAQYLESLLPAAQPFAEETLVPARRLADVLAWMVVEIGGVPRLEVSAEAVALLAGLVSSWLGGAGQPEDADSADGADPALIGQLIADALGLLRDDPRRRIPDLVIDPPRDDDYSDDCLGFAQSVGEPGSAEDGTRVLPVPEVGSLVAVNVGGRPLAELVRGQQGEPVAADVDLVAGGRALLDRLIGEAGPLLSIPNERYGTVTVLLVQRVVGGPDVVWGVGWASPGGSPNSWEPWMLGDPRVTGIDERLTDSLAQRTGWN
ncbi:MAG: hypothetical protein ACRCYU_10580, partial [Nocardioides sp.]